MKLNHYFFHYLSRLYSSVQSNFKRAGIKSEFQILSDDFLLSNAIRLSSPLFESFSPSFSHVILNPPYKKISSQSVVKKALLKVGIDTVNLYTAFVWMAMRCIKQDGELTAITPRSFCNGSYYFPFRKAFLKSMALDNINVFESRTAAFSEDAVLQENIIFHARKQEQKPSHVTITVSSGYGIDDVPEVKETPYSEVVKPDDNELYIRIPSDRVDNALGKQMDAFTSTLEDIGLEVSTGPVVDFGESALQRNKTNDTVPLNYPESIQFGEVAWPPEKNRKSIAIKENEFTRKWLIPSGWYVLVKRFSSRRKGGGLWLLLFHRCLFLL